MDIRKNIDIRKIILALMVIIFAVLIFVPVPGAYIPKKCSVDSDCVFAKTECCPACEGGFDSFSKDYANKYNAEMNKQCNETECPPLFCETVFGAGYQPKPVCSKEKCTTSYELQCTAVCSYYEQNLKAPYKLYLISIAEFENMTITKLAEKCGCIKAS